MKTAEIYYIKAWVQLARARHRKSPNSRGNAKRDERGEIAQTVIIVAVLAAAAITIATIIATKFISKAESIPGG